MTRLGLAVFCTLASVAIAGSPPVPGPAPHTLCAGAYHSCAVWKDGTVRCWGHGIKGQTGTGGDHGRPAPVAGISGAVEVACGEWFSCARLRTGGVRCWGAFASPEAVGRIDDAVSLSASDAEACVLRRSAAVQCWPGGELVSSRLSPDAKPGQVTTVVADGATQVSLGSIHGCALVADGAVKCFGENFTGQCAAPTEKGFVGVAAGGSHSCAWKADGSAVCWGNNEYGATGDEVLSRSHPPMRVSGLKDVKSMSVGPGYSCAIRRDGQVWCWGNNSFGQRGVVEGAAAFQPTVVKGLDQVAELAAGGRHLCARLTSGRIVCWGANFWGELGGGSEPNAISGAPSAVPRPIAE